MDGVGGKWSEESGDRFCGGNLKAFTGTKQGV